MTIKPHDYRCVNCGRLLFRATLALGCYIEIRCPKCGRISSFESRPAGVNTTCPRCGGEFGTHKDDCPDWVA